MNLVFLLANLGYRAAMSFSSFPTCVLASRTLWVIVSCFILLVLFGLCLLKKSFYCPLIGF